jgi:hypothetical protein
VERLLKVVEGWVCCCTSDFTCLESLLGFNPGKAIASELVLEEAAFSMDLQFAYS